MIELKEILNDAGDEKEGRLKTSEELPPKSREEEGVIKDILPFSQSFKELPNKFLVSTFFRIVKDFGMLMASMVGPYLTTTCGYIYLNMVGDPVMLASFGLFGFIYFAFHVSIMLSSLEKLGIQLSAVFGKRDYVKMKNTFSKGILTSIVLFLTITFPVSVFMRPVLGSVGVHKENLDIVQEALYFSLPMFVLMISKEILQTFCMAQGFEHYFGNMGIISSVFAIILNYFLIVTGKLGVLGWVYTRTLCSLGELIFTLIIFFLKTEKESRGVLSLKETLPGFDQFFFDSVKFTLGTYTEYLGFEIAGFFVLLKGDNDQTAAYYAAINVSGLTYTSGIALAIVARTRMNILIGMNLKQTARHYFEFFFLSAFSLGLFGTLFGLLGRELLADCYASATPEMRAWFIKLMILFALASPSETSACTAQVGLKTVGGVGQLLKYSALTVLLGNAIASPIFLYLRASVVYIYGWTMGLVCLYNLLVVLKALETDWNDIKLHGEGDEDLDQVAKLLQAQVSPRKQGRSDTFNNFGSPVNKRN